MADEFKHASVGTELSQAEWEAAGTHVADGQAAGDMVYFDGSCWKRRPFDVGARVYHSADQEVAHNTPTILAFNSERYDTDGIHDNAVNNSRLTCKTAGKYLICACIGWDTNADESRNAAIVLNGTTEIGTNVATAVSGDWTVHTVACTWDLEVDDYVEVRVKQRSGSALDVRSSAALSPEFMMQRIG